MNDYSNLAKIDYESLLDLFFQVPIYDDEDEFSYYSEIAWQIFQNMGERGIEDVLSKSLKNLNDAQLRSIIFLMGCSSQKEKYESRLGQYLSDIRPSIVAETINSLSLLKASNYLPIIVDMYGNTISAIVKGSILRYMQRLQYPKAKEVLVLALNDREPIVRENALDELDELGDSDVIPYIIPLLKDDNANVRQAAQTTLLNLEEKLKDSN
jgi:hypothetical protein